MKQTVMLLWFFINVSTHHVKMSLQEISSCCPAHSSFTSSFTEMVPCQVAPWCLSEVWGRPWSEMRPDWHAALEGFVVGVGLVLDYVTPSDWSVQLVQVLTSRKKVATS